MKDNNDPVMRPRESARTLLNSEVGPVLALVNRRVIGRLHQVDRMQTIAMVVVTLARFGDDAVVCSQQVPAPLPGRVPEHYILHDVELSSRATICRYETGC